MHTALITYILHLNDQPLTFQHLKQLQHHSLNQTKIINHPQQYIQIIITTHQIHQHTKLNKLQLNQQQILTKPNTNQTKKSFKQIKKNHINHISLTKLNKLQLNQNSHHIKPRRF